MAIFTLTISFQFIKLQLKAFLDVSFLVRILSKLFHVEGIQEILGMGNLFTKSIQQQGIWLLSPAKWLSSPAKLLSSPAKWLSNPAKWLSSPANGFQVRQNGFQVRYGKMAFKSGKIALSPAKWLSSQANWLSNPVKSYSNLVLNLNTYNNLFTFKVNKKGQINCL